MKKKPVLSAALALTLASAGILSAVALRADAAENAPAADASTTEASGYTVQVNGTTLALDASPQMWGSTMLVPVRNIAEALGAEVTYDPEAKTVTAVKGETRVALKLGAAEAEKNGSPLALSAPPVQVGDVVMVPLRFFGESFGTAVKWDGSKKRVTIDNESYLIPAVESYSNLKKLVKEDSEAGSDGIVNSAVNSGDPRLFAKDSSGDAVPMAGAASAGEKSKSEAADYSATNVQVQGVDEADVVKTDGEYIYQVNGNRIIIAKAYPADNLSVESAIVLDRNELTPIELYVDGDRLTVIGAAFDTRNVQDGAAPASGPQAEIMPSVISKGKFAPRQNTSVKTVVYDISDRKNPKAVKEVETEGSYVSSRKIGTQVYVIASRYLDRYRILNEDADPAAGPSYRDSAASDGKWQTAGYGDIRYFPDSALSSYMLIAGINPAKPEQASHVSVYLGSAQNVYASQSNLYVSFTQRSLSAELQKTVTGNGVFREKAAFLPEETSMVYKFLMEDGTVRFSAKGQVPGTVLNQFSMDEANGYFRIATTKGDVWGTGEEASKNNLYILDESMNISGQIEDIAPGEKIYSVRFMGNRGYMVTFKKVDPLFVLDLSNPSSPAILGKLKIPGYSDYLQPYDETHLIGFGKDAVEVANEWSNPGDVNSSPSTTAFYQGMKVAMFDVSDVANPKELFQTAIGDRGTDSELLRNHKALLFSKEKNLLAFPVTVAEVKGGAKAGPTDYGQFTFQGAYVYRVDLNEGFKLRGTITHMTQEELLKTGDGWYRGEHDVERVLYIGDTLYTLSKGQIRANDLESLSERKRLELK